MKKIKFGDLVYIYVYDVGYYPGLVVAKSNQAGYYEILHNINNYGLRISKINETSVNTI